MKTRPVTPNRFFASFRPFAARALKPLSLSPPMSVTTATLIGSLASGFAEPIEVTVNATTAKSASEATTIHLRIATYPP